MFGSGYGAGYLSVPGHPTILDIVRTRAYCACSKFGWELFGQFPLAIISFSVSLSVGDDSI